MPTFFCKRCGHSKDLETKEEFQKYKDKHRPRGRDRVRGYACDLVAQVVENKGMLKRGDKGTMPLTRNVLVRREIFEARAKEEADKKAQAEAAALCGV